MRSIDLHSKESFCELNNAISEIAAEIDYGWSTASTINKKRLARDWGGAGVIVTADKERRGSESDFVLTTPHAMAVSWYFNRVKKVAYVSGIDYLSKYSFFPDLAKSVAALPEDANEKRVFEALIEQTRHSLGLSTHRHSAIT
jgi:hypothetical protein